MYKKLFFGLIIVNILFFILKSVYFSPYRNQSLSLRGTPKAYPQPSQLITTSTPLNQSSPRSSSKKIFLRKDVFLVKTTAMPKILSIDDQTEEVSFFDPESKKYTAEKVFKARSGGELYIGQDDPLISSTHTLVAYINQDDNNIWIMDVDGNNKNKISSEGYSETETFFGSKVSLTAWSDDERFLVYHARSGEGGPGSEDKLVLPMLSGFYIADLDEGAVYYLPGIQGVIGFIPGTHQLLFSNDGITIVSFTSWDMLTDEIKIITKKTFSSWAGLFSFSKNSYMAYGHGSTSDSSNFSALVYASLDNTYQKEIARGSWAEVRSPTISPDDTWIAYIKETPALCASGGGGCPQGTLFLYNTATEKTEYVLDSVKKIHYWYDDENLLILRGTHERPWSLELFNIVNKTSTIISHNATL